MWDPPPEEVLFGIPRGYIIRYEGDEELNSTELISFDQTFFLLQNLSEAVNYSIEVTAVTGAGEGPYSPPVFVVTDEDGKLNAKCELNRYCIFESYLFLVLQSLEL